MKTSKSRVLSALSTAGKIAVKTIIFTFLIVVFSCKTEKDPESSVKETPVYKAIPSVCIWDKISARKEPLRNSQIVTPLNLGESVSFLGITESDSTYKNQEYLKIKLSDGSMVWVPSFAMVINSKPGVVSNETDIYLRPDLLTITEKKLSPMEIIAVIETQDGWVNFVSEKREESGWIPDEGINYNREEIAFSLMAKRILTEKSNKTLLQKLDSVLKINPYQNSVFLPLMNEIKSQEMEKKLMDDLIMNSIDSL